MLANSQHTTPTDMTATECRAVPSNKQVPVDRLQLIVIYTMSHHTNINNVSCSEFTLQQLSPNSTIPTSPWRLRQTRDVPFSPNSTGKFRGSRRNGIWAKGDVTGLSRTCRRRYGEVDRVEFGLYTLLAILWLQWQPTSIFQWHVSNPLSLRAQSYSLCTVPPALWCCYFGNRSIQCVKHPSSTIPKSLLPGTSHSALHGHCLLDVRKSRLCV